MPMMEMFDRGIQLRMGQAHVKRWVDDILPLVSDDVGPARRPRPHDPPGAAGRGAAHVRGVPAEGGRLREGRPQAVTAGPAARARWSWSPAPRAASAAPPRWPSPPGQPGWCCRPGRRSRCEAAAEECRAAGRRRRHGGGRRRRRDRRGAGPGRGARAVRPGRRLGAHRSGGGVRPVRGRAVRDVPPGTRHRGARDGARGPGRPRPVPLAGPRHPGAHRFAAGRDRDAVHEQLRHGQVGRPRARPGARDRDPRRTRTSMSAWCRPAASTPRSTGSGGELRRPGRATAAAGGPAGEGRPGDRAVPGRPPAAAERGSRQPGARGPGSPWRRGCSTSWSAR